MATETPLIGVASTGSGSGKTLVTLALLEYYGSMTDVQPFKVGPDFIDPKYHEVLSDRPSLTVDQYLMPEDVLKPFLRRSLSGAGIGVVEGVMGLYDGKSGRPGSYSTAQFFRRYGIPYLLVVDASGKSHSLAAEVEGFLRHDPRLDCKGLVLVNVAGNRHERMLRRAVNETLSVPIVAGLHRDDAFSLPSRHLGLDTSDLDRTVRVLRERIKSHVVPQFKENGDYLPEPCKTGSGSDVPEPVFSKDKRAGLTVGVAYDKAFSFYYDYNLRLLKRGGARLVPVSPLNDTALPDELNGLYLGGGYPEAYAGRLESNRSFRRDLRNRLRGGLPCLAECGGFMYLGNQLQDTGEEWHEMTGWIPARFKMNPDHQALGYVSGEARENEFLSVDGELRGHEFHYASADLGTDAPYFYTLNRGKGVREGRDGLIRGRTLAGFVHWHWASCRNFPRSFLEVCSSHRSALKVD